MYLNRDHDSPTHVVSFYGIVDAAASSQPRWKIFSLDTIPLPSSPGAIYALSNPMTHLAYLDRDITAFCSKHTPL